MSLIVTDKDFSQYATYQEYLDDVQKKQQLRSKKETRKKIVFDTYQEYMEETKRHRMRIRLCDVPEEFRTDTLTMKYIKRCPNDIQYVTNPSDEMCQVVLGLNGFAINKIKNKEQKKKYLPQAVSKVPELMCRINRPGEELYDNISYDSLKVLPDRKMVPNKFLLRKMMSRGRVVIS